MENTEFLADITSKTLRDIEQIRGILGDASNRDRGGNSSNKKSSVEEQLELTVEIVRTQIASKNIVRKQLCAVLLRVSNDTFEIAKLVAPILITFSLSKSISVPSEPLAIALVAIAIGRMGVAALCPDNDHNNAS